MKKIRSLFVVNFALLFGANLGACSNNNKADLLFGDMHAESLTTLSYGQLKEKVDSKESFMLAVQYSDNCGCWSDAKPVIERYIKEKHVNCYHIKLAELDGNDNRFNIEIISGNVTLAIFKDGEVKKCTTTKEDSLKVYDSFVSFVESVIQLPKMYYINLEDLNNLYKTPEKNIVYFSRATCGDCSYVNTSGLKSWSAKTKDYSKKIYVLDCDQPGIRYNTEGVYDKDQWQAFKHTYGLSTLNNPTYGYDTGYVPSFYLIQGSEAGVSFLSGSVTFNDSIAKGEDGAYYVTNSYYTEERLPNLAYIDSKVKTKVLKGMKVSEGVVEKEYEGKTYATWDHPAAEKYHNIFLEKFLDWSNKQ